MTDPVRSVARRIQASRRYRVFFAEARPVTRDFHSQLAADGASPSDADHNKLLIAAISRSCSALICTDLQGIVTAWHESATRLFGYSAAEMIGAPFFRVVPEEFHQHESAVLHSLSC